MAWLEDRGGLRRSHARSQDAARDWYESASYRALEEAFAGLGRDDAEAVAVVAERLLKDGVLFASLLTPLIDHLAADPLFEPPLRVHRDALRIGAVLFECPLVSITASVLSAEALSALPAPRMVLVPGRLSIVRYARAGGARLRQWRAGPIGDDFDAGTAPRCLPVGMRDLTDGAVLRLDGRTDAHLIEAARGDVVTITAMIRAGAAPLMREYALPGGALVRSATLDDGASRTQMLLTLLRLSGRADAGDRFDAATRDGAFFLRWAAMREWLALDAGAALPRLRAMAEADRHAEVRAAALATLPMVEARLCHA